MSFLFDPFHCSTHDFHSLSFKYDTRQLTKFRARALEQLSDSVTAGIETWGLKDMCLILTQPDCNRGKITPLVKFYSI